MTRLFFSYSHKDEALRDELQFHLESLRHQGIIDMWHDRRISAGREFDNVISENLEKADIILLLVSSYFISSKYCFGVEMKRAMQRHDDGEARTIPVILRPCDWYGLPFGKLLATPPDGRAVTKFADLHDAFYEVTKAIRAAAEELGSHDDAVTEVPAENQTGVTGATRSSTRQDIRSGNLRVKKQFSDHEKDQFLDDAFEYIANYFENSLNEMGDRDPKVDSRFRRIDSNQFSVAVYINGIRKSGCRIWIGDRYFNNAIGFSFNESRDDGSYNEMLRVEDNGYSLFLKAMGFQLQHRAGNAPLTNEGGAEYLWRMFIDPLQR